MNPPSIVWGGGVHDKVCWLIAYEQNPTPYNPTETISSRQPYVPDKGVAS